MDYVELHCHSNFSLLDGASHPSDLARRAAELGMTALALTDHDAVYGAMHFATSAHLHGIKPIFGAELTLEGGHHLTLLVRDAEGWSNLCQLITHAQQNAPKGQAALPKSLLAKHSTGLIALSGCRHGEIATAILRREYQQALDLALEYQRWFPDFYIELQQHFLPQERTLNQHFVDLAARIGADIVATNNVHYAQQDGHRLQDVLVCIRHQTTLTESSRLRRPNSEYYLKSAGEMQALFAQYPHAIRNTLHIAEQCNFIPQAGLQTLPPFPVPDGYTPSNYIRHICQTNLARKGDISERGLQQLDYELTIIERAGLINYFLIVWDVVRFSREQGVLCQGRGSAANSFVAYALGITPIDPLEHNLVFERFLSDERQLTPDIDIDFAADGREDVIQYIYERYGHEHTAMACTFITFRTRSAIRDIGKVLGIPLDLLTDLSKSVDHREQLALDHPQGSLWQHLFELVEQIRGFPRHLGIHNGGMVITGPPLATRIPIEPATFPDRYVVQWDKEGLEDAGMVKIDILGLRMLSAVAESLRLIEAAWGEQIGLDNLHFDDPAVFDLICRADTIGVFQVESRAQAQVLPRLQPRQFNDLIVSISLIRPGPVQGNMVHPYLRRRLGHETITYPHPLLEDALAETLGVILFQEQVLKVARDLAGFTAGQGELLRRALSSKHAHADIERLYDAFIAGAASKGVAEEDAEAVFDKLRAFGGYSFPKSHAAAFAVVVYQSAWLKQYYPAAFYAALLNNQPMGFWQPAVILRDAKQHGVAVLPVCIQHSGVNSVLEGGKIRLGLAQVKGFGVEVAERILTARTEGAFTDIHGFCRRTRLPRRLVEHLIRLGAMDSWGIPRRNLLWEFGKIRYFPMDLRDAPDDIQFPTLTPLEQLQVEYELLGLSITQHPMELYRRQLQAHRIPSSAELQEYADGSTVIVAGLLVVKQAPYTAKGVVFLTLEDEFAFINIVLYPAIYETHRELIRTHPVLIVKGKIQRQDKVVNVVGEKMMAL